MFFGDLSTYARFETSRRREKGQLQNDDGGKSLVGRLANGWKKVIIAASGIERQLMASEGCHGLNWTSDRVSRREAKRFKRPWFAEFPVPWMDPLTEPTSVPDTPITLGPPTAWRSKQTDGLWRTIVSAPRAINKISALLYKVSYPLVMAKGGAHSLFPFGW